MGYGQHCLLASGLQHRCSQPDGAERDVKSVESAEQEGRTARNGLVFWAPGLPASAKLLSEAVRVEWLRRLLQAMPRQRQRTRKALSTVTRQPTSQKRRPPTGGASPYLQEPTQLSVSPSTSASSRS